MFHTSSKNIRARYVFLSIAVAVISVGAAFAEFGHTANSPQTTPTTPLGVTISAVRLQDSYRVDQIYAGRIVAGRSSALGFQRGGLLVLVTVDEGGRVKKGDLIAKIDTRALEARRNQALAKLDHARALKREVEARHSLALKTSERKASLADKGHLSRDVHDQAVAAEKALFAQLGAASAAIKETKTSLQSIELDIELSHLRAPFSGSITRRLLDEGTALKAGEAIVNLIEDTSLEAHIGVPFEAANMLIREQSYDIAVNGVNFPARLKAVVAEVDIQTRSVFAIFTLDDTGQSPLTGQIGKLALSTVVRDSGYWLPVESLAEGSRGMWNTYAVVDGDDGAQRVEQRHLIVLHTETDRVFVRGTLEDGDSVVTSGLHRLVPGQNVTISSL